MREVGNIAEGKKMKTIIITLISIIGFFILLSSVKGATNNLNLFTNETGAGDIYVSNTTANDNFGTATTLSTGISVGLDKTRSYIRFNLSSVPINSRIKNATLFLIEDDLSVESLNISIYDVNDTTQVTNWNELTSVWNNQSCGSASNNLNTSCNSTRMDSKIVSSASSNISFSVTTSAISGYDRTSKLSLMILENLSIGFTGIVSTFVSDDATGTTNDPKLQVQYNRIPTIAIGVHNPISPPSYVSGVTYRFNTTVNDRDGVSDFSTVLFEENFTGSFRNNTVSTSSDLNTSARNYTLTFSDLGLGTHFNPNNCWE